MDKELSKESNRFIFILLYFTLLWFILSKLHVTLKSFHGGKPIEVAYV